MTQSDLPVSAGRPLRILQLNSMLSGGGTDDRSVRIAHALLALGHKVWMAGPGGREFSKVAEALGLPFHRLETGPAKLGLILGTAKFIRRERVQVLHARHGRDYWPAVLAARLSRTGVKVVLSRHLAKSPGSWASRHFLLSQCDAFVAVSEFVAKVLKEGHSDLASDNPERHRRAPMQGDFTKIRVVYGGFDMGKFCPGEAVAQRSAWGLEPQVYAYAVVGGYDFPRGKGQSEFLKAAALMKSEAPHARFLIIGRGNMREALERQVVDLGLTEVARLTPYCQDMPAAMNAIDCMVLPQVGTEAIPGVVCEAHACGKPVIASDLDGIPEAFAPGGYGELVTRGDVPALAAAMKRWCRRPALTMSERVAMHQRVAERFSLERAARELSALYDSLLT